MQSLLGSFFERASPTYDQSKTIWWFDPAYHLRDGLNYDRYGASDVKESEGRLLPALALGDEKLPLKLLLTSSGVAAFTVLQQFLMSKVFAAGDTIVTSPYPLLRVLRASTTGFARQGRRIGDVRRREHFCHCREA
jgi:cystathionine gamma-synthase